MTPLPCRTSHPRTTAVAIAVSMCVLLSGCATGARASAAAPEAVARHVDGTGIHPALVYTTEVPGYDLAPQSVGVTGEDGMSASWVDADTGAVVSIRTASGELTAEDCASTPLWEGAGGTVTCTQDGDTWHREADGIDEYVVQREDTQVWVFGRSDAPAALLRVAATNVRVPTEAELDLLFADVPATSGEPVERGDLPEHGDGAPIDPSGPGG